MKKTQNKQEVGAFVTVTDTGYRAKPLCELGDQLLCYKKGYLGTLDKENVWTPVTKCVGGIWSLLSTFRPFERILRLSPRCGQALSATSAIVSHKGRVLYVDLKNKTVTTEHIYCDGMSNPLSFAKVVGIEGFEDGFYYGEYTGNPDCKAVAIYYRPIEDKPCQWKKVYEFPAGSITHIHAIIPDKYRKGVIIMTGDSDEGSGIYLFYDNFKNVTTVAGGSQQSRSCVAFVREEGIYYATDTPFDQNYVYFASEQEEGNWYSEALAKIDGSCIYGGETQDHLVFNTVVETDSEKKGLHLLFTYKRGPGIVDWYTKVYVLDKNGENSMVLKYKKDIFPMGLCQFGSVCFCPSGEKNTLWISPTAVKRYDGRLLKIKIEQK